MSYDSACLPGFDIHEQVEEAVDGLSDDDTELDVEDMIGCQTYLSRTNWNHRADALSQQDGDDAIYINIVFDTSMSSALIIVRFLQGVVRK
jgi:hypothetical protein